MGTTYYTSLHILRKKVDIIAYDPKDMKEIKNSPGSWLLDMMTEGTDTEQIVVRRQLFNKTGESLPAVRCNHVCF